MPYWRLFYHFVWTTKQVEPLIGPGFEQDLHKAIAAKVSALGGTAHAVGGMADHIHLVASVPPKLALSSFIGQVKGATSHFVNHVICPGYAFAWQEEYGVLTVSERALDKVVRYALDQRTHHRQGSLLAPLERFSDEGSPPGASRPREVGHQ